VHSLWEYPRRTLAEEINQHALSKQPFPPGEIKHLISHIAGGMSVLQRHQLSHECLTSKTILVESATVFRVVDPATLQMSPNLDVIYHKRSLKNIYLAPEQCRIIDQQNLVQGRVNPYRADVFTAGMLVLEAGLLQRQDDCYEDECSRVNWKQVELNVNKFG
jgi:hypothetical protein